jgi:cholesterol 25-hydroxylase
MLGQLVLSLVIYDAIFFVLHLAMHKVPYFAKMHARHHEHGAIDTNITNQMDIPERLAIVLSVIKRSHLRN